MSAKQRNTASRGAKYKAGIVLVGMFLLQGAAGAQGQRSEEPPRQEPLNKGRGQKTEPPRTKERAQPQEKKSPGQPAKQSLRIVVSESEEAAVNRLLARGSAPPAFGIHPRVCLTASELPALRQRIQTQPAKEAFAACERVAAQLLDPKSPDSVTVARLERGETGIGEASKQQLSETIRETAFVSLVGGKPEITAAGKKALLAFVAHVSFKAANTDMSRQATGIGLGYDWLYNELTNDERRQVHDWLVRNCSAYAEFLENQPFGFKRGFEKKRNMNWVPFYAGSFGVAALAIEGETGYQSEWYAKAASGMKNFLDNGIGKEGAPMETIHYFAYGMAHGAVFLDAMARRGDAQWEHPNLRQIPLWWAYDLLPWGRDFNSIADTRDLHMGVAEIYYRLNLAYPSDPVMQWVYKNYSGSDNGFPLAPFAAALWAVPPNPSVQITNLKLPLSRYFAQNGLAYLRSGWGADDTYFEFQSDPMAFGVSHAHADRNSFTLMSKGRIWALDRGYHYNRGNDHNLVLIDGKSEGAFPHPGRIVAYNDAGWATSIAGDAKRAYDWKAEMPGTAGTLQIGEIESKAFNAVTKAYRSGTLVRGKFPYVVIADDIQKDTQSHEYVWQMLSPLGTQVETLDSNRVLLKPVDSGSYLRLAPGVTYPEQEPLRVSVDIKKTGRYRVFLLMGHDYSASWTLGGHLAVDQGSRIRFYAKEGDNARMHWQKLASDSPVPNLDLTAGRHEINIWSYGTVDFAALLVAPEDFDPLQAQSVTFPPNSTVYRFADLGATPRGWQRVEAERNEPRLLVQVVSTGAVQFKADLLHNPLENDKANTDSTVVRIQAATFTKTPKFRVLLYPHRAGDPLPQVENRGDVMTVTWSDETRDIWEFGQKSSLGDAMLDAAVMLQRKFGQNTQTLRLVW